MASKNCSKPSPLAKFDKKGNPCSTDSDHIQETQALRSLDSGNKHGNDGDENHNLFGQSEVDERGLHQYPLSTEELYKRCKWFEGTDGASVAFSISQSNHSKMSLKNLYHRVTSRREASPTTICSLEDEEHHFALSSQQPASASLKTNPESPVPICLPPGCIPSNMIVQFTRKES